jgi:uncharacterized repeat protein (TIGR01451 family)
VHVLQPNQSGLAQISNILKHQSAVTELHILSHGQPGQVLLGTSGLTTQQLYTQAQSITGWASAFAPGAHLLLYGCNVAAGAVGRDFVQTLAELTGTHVAAATHPVGAASLGGRWQLDYQTGAPAPPLALDALGQAAYTGILATAFPNLFYANVATSLFVLDLTNGEADQVGTLAFNTNAIAREAENGRIYYIGQGTDRRVAFFDPFAAPGSQNTILPFDNSGSAGTGFVKLAQAQNGVIYAMNLSETLLYAVNQTTGELTVFGDISGGTTPFSAGSGDMAFDPNDANRLIITVAPGGQTIRLYSVDISDPANLNAVFIGDSGISADGAGSLAFGQDGQLYTSSDEGGTDGLWRLSLTDATATRVADTVRSDNNASLQFNDFGTLPIPTPDIDIQVNVPTGQPEAQPGDTVTYVVTVTNNSGTFDVNNVPLLIGLPPEITNITFDGSPSGNTISTTVDLTANEIRTFTVTGVVDAGTPVNTPLTTTVSSPPIPGLAESNPGSNSTTVTTQIVSGISNQPPITDPVTGTVPPVAGEPTQLPALSGSDPDGTLTSFQILSLPPAGQGQLFLGDPNQGGTAVGLNQVIPVGQANQLFFVPTDSFAGASFSYTGIDDDQEPSVTPGTFTLAVGTLEPNLPPLTDPITTDVKGPGEGVTRLSALSGSDPDGTLSGFRILSLPIAGEGRLFLGNPNQGGTPIAVNQLIPPNQANQVFFRALAAFSGTASFTYTAVDNLGATSLTPATVTLQQISVPPPTGGCLPGLVITGTNQADTLVGTTGQDTMFGLAGDDTIRGGDCGDVIFGGPGDDRLFGEGGNDRLIGGAGNDTLRGGAGNDTLNGGAGNDLLLGGGGRDLLRGSAGNDTLRGGAGNDTLFGNNGNDALFGDGGNDVLRGGAGRDTLRGGPGDDLLFGNNGNDLLFGGNGNDTLDGGAGNDTLRGGPGNDVLRGKAGNDVLFGGGGDDFILGGNGNDALFGGPGNDTLIGGAGNDTLRGGNGADVLRGGAGRDLLFGGAGNDTLFGNNGNDTLLGGPGDDLIFGGAGDDVLRGGAGDDRLFGGVGDDTIFGGPGNDLINGGSGNDVLFGGAGNDTIRGGAGRDTLYGGPGNDRLFGGSNDDVLFGGQGNDILRGNNGNDTLYAGAGRNRLIGGAGNDVLVSGGGRNVLVGGNGADTFAFLGASKAAVLRQSRVANRDRILDFNQTEGDRILLSFNNSLQATTPPPRLFNAGVVVANTLAQAAAAAYLDKNQTAPGNQALTRNQALFFDWQGGTYLSVNNALNGFNQNQDMVVNMSSMVFKPGDGNAGVLNVADYFVV